MESVTEKASQQMKEFGIEIVDVRIKRTDLPAENQRAIFDRMRAERERQATQYRSEGAEESTKIRSGADKERAVILAGGQQEGTGAPWSGRTPRRPASMPKPSRVLRNSIPSSAVWKRSASLSEKTPAWFSRPTVLCFSPSSSRGKHGTTGYGSVRRGVRRMLFVSGKRTQSELAELLNLQQGSISEAKKRGIIPLSWCVRVSDLFHVRMDWLRFGEPPVFMSSARQGVSGEG